MIALVILSHGHMAKEALNSTKMIMGEVENVFSLSLEGEDSKESFNLKVLNLMEKLDCYKKIIIFVDIIGGTPYNIVISNFIHDDRVEIISGFNLGMIIEFASLHMAGHGDNVLEINKIVNVGMDQIIDVKGNIRKELSKQ